MASEKRTAAQAGNTEGQTETYVGQTNVSDELGDMLAEMRKFIAMLRPLRAHYRQPPKKLTRTERRLRDSLVDCANLMINVGIMAHGRGDERALDLVADARAICVEVSAIFGLQCNLPPAAGMLAQIVKAERKRTVVNPGPK